jgi:small ligand-binding sensory domain FIST
MTDFLSSHIRGKDWQSTCQTLADSLDSGPFGKLAFVYISDTLAGDTDAIVDRLRQLTGIPHWVGCVGMGLCGTGSESYQEPAVSVLTTPFADEDFRILTDFDQVQAWLSATSEWRLRSMSSVAIVHGNPANEQLPEHLTELSEGLGGGYLIGGIASAEKSPLQVADRATDSALSGVLFSGQVKISTGLSQGCSLIGSKHTISTGQRNVIETIDDRPALDVFKEDIGEVLSRDLTRVAGYIFAALPIRGSDTGDYLVRNLIGIDPDRGLLAIGDLIEPGMEIQFARRDAQTARDDLVRMVQDLQQRLPGPARGALYHSCLGRGHNLFGDDGEELRLIREQLGDVPLAGFYANGEISHQRLYGYTGILTLFS